MKNILIISPHFPPVNAPDMQRIRMSLPYYRKLGWEPVVISVKPEFVDGFLEEALVNTYPSDIEIHRVNAWPLSKTSRIGFGSLSIRSFFQVMKKGNELLRSRRFDMVFFSTSNFHVCRLGPYWKRKFKVPFVIDMQDPWRNDFYLDKPASERPPKFRWAYLLDKKLEAATIPKAAGILSVSDGYIQMLLNRYSGLRKENCLVLPFSASEKDHEVAESYYPHGTGMLPDKNCIHLVYAGRGGKDLRKALEIIFGAVQIIRAQDDSIFKKLRLTFVGTSYAGFGKGIKTIIPIAQEFHLEGQVNEITDRIPFLKTLALLKEADVLMVPGSTDVSYTASKIFPYILSARPLLAVFNQHSSVLTLLSNIKFGKSVAFQNEIPSEAYMEECAQKLLSLIQQRGEAIQNIDMEVFTPYLAASNTKRQIDFFEKLLLNDKKNNA